MKNIQNQLFFFTIIFFGLGMIHISLALVGLLCFTIPFIQYFIHKDKIWCKYVCPRAGFFNRVIAKINLGIKPPRFLTTASTKDIVVTYFAINLFFVAMSTIMVGVGRIAPLEEIRFMIYFTVPIRLPQMLSVEIAPVLVHLSYRVYSMIFTSVIVGSVLGIVYRPRTWCAICPVNTLTTKNPNDN